MKKIIPFKKDIIFKTNLAEVTSISLEHTLHLEEQNVITGVFTVSGDYKITDTSINVEDFSYDLPFDINMDEKYILDKANIDINDFYYEIINENVLSVNIEVIIDKLEEKLIEEPVLEEPVLEEPVLEEVRMKREDILESISDLEVNTNNKVEEDVAMEEQIIDTCEEPERCIEDEKITSLFDNMDDTNETYQSYKICIVREGDTLETIMEKYTVTKEALEDYNDLKEFKIGVKIIIPTNA